MISTEKVEAGKSHHLVSKAVSDSRMVNPSKIGVIGTVMMRTMSKLHESYGRKSKRKNGERKWGAQEDRAV